MERRIGCELRHDGKYNTVVMAAESDCHTISIYMGQIVRKFSFVVLFTAMNVQVQVYTGIVDLNKSTSIKIMASALCSIHVSPE